MWGFHMLPRYLTAKVTIGASGAPTLANTKNGVASCTRLTTGTYQLQLADNYLHFQGMEANFESPVSGGAVNMGSLSTGTVYQIVTLGTSTQAQWVTAGVPAGITAAPGVVFKAAGAGAGNGTVKVLGASGISGIEVLGNQDLMLNNQPFSVGSGGYITFATLGPVLTMNSYTPAGTNNSATPPIFTGTPATLTGTVSYAATDPANGSIMYLRMWFNDSSVQ